jgi:hypothetical protein
MFYGLALQGNCQKGERCQQVSSDRPGARKLAPKTEISEIYVATCQGKSEILWFVKPQNHLLDQPGSYCQRAVFG